MEYRRARGEGGTYFFTVVTYERRKILTAPQNVALLLKAPAYVMDAHPFKIDAVVLLPDHVHSVWTLPEGDHDYSTRWRLIKSYFSRYCDGQYRKDVGLSRLRKKEQGMWQRQYWEHEIRDDKDYQAHCNYVHYNPVKHGLVKAPKDWRYSSFHGYVKKGVYDWGWGSEGDITFGNEVGNE